MSGRHALARERINTAPAVLVTALTLNTIGWWQESNPAGWLLNGTAVCIALFVYGTLARHHAYDEAIR